jgi:hypothetical protein
MDALLKAFMPCCDLDHRSRARLAGVFSLMQPKPGLVLLTGIFPRRRNSTKDKAKC